MTILRFIAKVTIVAAFGLSLGTILMLDERELIRQTQR